jgi:chromosome segregation ATPase
MNPIQDPAFPDHLRFEVEQLEKMRGQILADLETLRQQEQNLRSYEARLRGAPPAPATSTSDLDADREKLGRLRGLLEAERRALVDERLALREERAAVAAQAEDLRQREAWLEVREREFQARQFAPPPDKATEASPFTFRLGLNEVPFAEYFRGSRRSA